MTILVNIKDINNFVLIIIVIIKRFDIIFIGTFNSWVIAEFLIRKEAIICLRKIY